MNFFKDEVGENKSELKKTEGDNESKKKFYKKLPNIIIFSVLMITATVLEINGKDADGLWFMAVMVALFTTN